MKKTIFFSAILIATLTLGSCSSNPIKMLGDIDGVHHLHIPSWLLAVTGSTKDFGKDLEDINLSSIRNLRIYAADDKNAAAALYDKARKVAKDNGYELALKANDDGDEEAIYVKQDGKRTRLIIVGAESGEETAVVSLSAKISADDLSKLISID